MVLEDDMNDPNLGCCGYDELAVKPPTTTPFIYPRKAAQAAAQAGRSHNPGVTRPVYSMGVTTPIRFPVRNLLPVR